MSEMDSLAQLRAWCLDQMEVRDAEGQHAAASDLDQVAKRLAAHHLGPLDDATMTPREVAAFNMGVVSAQARLSQQLPPGIRFATDEEARAAGERVIEKHRASLERLAEFDQATVFVERSREMLERLAKYDTRHVGDPLKDAQTREAALRTSVIVWMEMAQAAQAEVDRLKAGKFTKEEIHAICHNLHGTVSAQEFADGCAAEQRKIYGCAPDRDELEKLKADEKDCACSVPDYVGYYGEPAHWRCLLCGRHPAQADRLYVRLLDRKEVSVSTVKQAESARASKAKPPVPVPPRDFPHEKFDIIAENAVDQITRGEMGDMQKRRPQVEAIVRRVCEEAFTLAFPEPPVDDEQELPPGFSEVEDRCHDCGDSETISWRGLFLCDACIAKRRKADIP